MISDGSIIENKTRTNRQKVVSLEIHNNDRYILEMFDDSINADKSIIKYNNKRNHVYLRFASDKMATDLSKYGVVPRKSHISYLPMLKKRIDASFIAWNI